MVFELNTIRVKILARKAESCRMVYKIMFVCIWERNTYSISIPAYLRMGNADAELASTTQLLFANVVIYMLYM